MKKYSLLTLLIVLVITAFAQKTPWRPGAMELKINFKNPQEAAQLGEMHLDADIYADYAYAYVVPDELALIKNAGFEYEILKPDLNAWSASFGEALVPPGYYTFAQIKDIADSLATAYPAICKKVVFGQTATGLELAALKISDSVEADENEPEILFDGGIHGDEVGGSQNMIYFARDLCKGYGTDTLLTNLINTREIWLYYCVNPYGRNQMTRENSNYVDVNRDFGYMWGAEGSSPSPFSQLESKALRKCKLDNQFVVYTNYHSGTRMVSYPWSNRVPAAPDKETINRLAQVYVSNSGYGAGQLPYGQGAIVMYFIQGATKDYDYGSLGSIGWSIEISDDKQPPSSQIQYYYNMNKPAMLALIQHCGYGIQGTVTDAVTGQPVAAAVFEGNNYPSYSDGVVGDYHRYLKPGTYTLKIAANGYETKTITDVTVNDLQCTTVDVQLQPIAGHYAYRVLASHIPNLNGNNPGDELYSPACLMAPDQVSYSLGKNGYVIVDMQDSIINVEGDDVIVYEGDASPESFTLYAGNTMDGPWISLGSGVGTTSFDLGKYNLSQARYYKIKDNSNGTANVSDAGFEFDAIASLHPAIPDTVAHLNGTLYDGVTGLPIPNGIVSSGDSSCITDENGLYDLTLIRGNNIICADAIGYGLHCDTLALLPATITTHDFYLTSDVGINDNPESNDALLWPNPASDKATITFWLPAPQKVSIKVVNNVGKVCVKLAGQKFPAGENSCTINLAEQKNVVAPGFYTVIIEGTAYHKCLKMLKCN
ncbi:MAG TPA: M14 family zinc carboxypeptidase [Bacteroidales bacterium]|nr:M14 family zinc carboxypeptidase [Bacteroidales bacterium]